MLYGVIPFRKGSKAIKDKNMKPLNYVPLVQYTMDAARNSELESIILTTDYDQNIIETIIDSPKFRYVNRPSKYCTDEISAVTAINHLYDEGIISVEDYICLLQPTCPLRTAKDINMALLKFYMSDKETLVSVTKGPALKKMYFEDGEKVNKELSGYNKQEDMVTYVRNSSIYIFPVEKYIETGSIFDNEPVMYIMPSYRSIDIDYIDDKKHAEYLIDGGVLRGK